MYSKFHETLPSHLQTRLALIIQSASRFWEQRLHLHFINYGKVRSERVQQKLDQLIDILPVNQRLTSDELFIILAAVWLYELGVQSPDLSSIGIEYKIGDRLLPSELHMIQRKKHLLSDHLIRSSGNNLASPLHIDLIPALPLGDDYTQRIADVCLWNSDEPIEDAPEGLPIRGSLVRIRLLAALLRLADQLYIDESCIDNRLLQNTPLPLDEFAKWWLYNYAQTVPIENSQICFYYSLPKTQGYLLDKIRSFFEPNFAYNKNSTIRYLWKIGLHLMPVEDSVQQELSEFKPEIPDKLIQLLSEVESSPILSDTSSIEQSIQDELNVTYGLQDILTQLYPKASSIEVVSHEAGIAFTRIPHNNNSAVDIWYYTMRQAEKQDRVDKLIEIAIREYPRNDELQDAVAAYRNYLELLR